MFPGNEAIQREDEEMHLLLRQKLESLEAFIASHTPQSVKDVLKNGPYYATKNPGLYKLQLAKVLFAFFSQLYRNGGIKLLWGGPHEQLLEDLRRYASSGIEETAAGLWAGRQGMEHTQSYVSQACFNLLEEVYTEEAFVEEQAEDWANLSEKGIIFKFPLHQAKKVWLETGVIADGFLTFDSSWYGLKAIRGRNQI